MPYNEPIMTGLEKLSNELQVRKEGRKSMVDLRIDYRGYFQLCEGMYNVMRAKWLTWFPTDVVPIERDGFLEMCATLLIKRIEYVRSEQLGEEPRRTGIGKAIVIPAPIYVRLYSYGYVDVGGDRYLPTVDGILEFLPHQDKVAPVYTKPNDALKAAYSEFVMGLTPRLIVSQAMPSQPEGTMAMLFYVVEQDEFNKPYALSDLATSADAALAGISPDQPLAVRRKGTDFRVLRDYIAFMFIHPFSTIEGPEMALRNFLEKGFRGGEVGA